MKPYIEQCQQAIAVVAKSNDYLADKLGAVRALQAQLAEIETDLKGQVKVGGEPVVGLYYEATPVYATKTTTAWKYIAERLGAKDHPLLISRNTRRSEYEQVRVVARKQEAVA